MYIRNILSVTIAAVVAAPVLLVKISTAEAQKFVPRDRLIQGLQMQQHGQPPRLKRRGARNRNGHTNGQRLRARNDDVRIRRAPSSKKKRLAKRRAPQGQVQQLRVPPKRLKRRAPQQDNKLVLRRAPRGTVQEFRAPPPKNNAVRSRAPQGNAKLRRPPSNSGSQRIRAPQDANAPQKFRAPPPKKQLANRDRAPVHNTQSDQQVANLNDRDDLRGIAVKPAGKPYPDLASVDLEILFEYNSDRIDPKSVRQLITLGEALQDAALQSSRIMIAGHTDATGSNAYNDDLSYRRARSVYEFLTAYAGVDPDRLYVEGYGEELLKYPDAPNSGQNRRVEIINLGA